MTVLSPVKLANAADWVSFDSFAYQGVGKSYEKETVESGEYFNPIFAGWSIIATVGPRARIGP